MNIKKIKNSDKIFKLEYTNSFNVKKTIYFYYPPNDIAPTWANQKGITTYFSIGLDKVDILFNKIRPYISNNDNILELPCGVGEFCMNLYNEIKHKNLQVKYLGLELSEVFVKLNKINNINNKLQNAF